jgi:hypothetical protein
LFEKVRSTSGVALQLLVMRHQRADRHAADGRAVLPLLASTSFCPWPRRP